MNCNHCGMPINKKSSAINRAEKIGAPMYCNKTCFGLSRRNKNPQSESEKKEAKRIYDANRRIQKAEEIRAKKRAYYAANHDREKERISRKKRMPLHVLYCQRPEYVEYKKQYDRERIAKMFFGEFADAALILQDVEKEIAAKATRYEVYLTNGTINKALMRRRSMK